MRQSTSNSSSNNSENAEVSKFSAMSRQWWDPNINPLIGMNVIRLEYIRRSILRYYDVPYNDNTSPFVSERPTVILPLNGMRVLDIGCGGGLLSESLARLGATHVVGIDPSIDLIAVAKKRTENDSMLHRTISYIGGISAEQFLVQEGSNGYDAVFLLEVVEHVDNPKQLIETAVALLRPGGLLFLSTINRTYKSFLLTIVGAEYVMRYLPPGTHNWKQYFSPQEIEKLVTDTTYAQQLDVSGMIIRTERNNLIQLARNITSGTSNWDWNLDPLDHDVNWIGCYTKSNE
jgi:2-polyprenyl-6-hydroxyphenyl methylase / 3-demethylubiquinone-9 3-methyltransferase